jgi:hypothetical protein
MKRIKILVFIFIVFILLNSNFYYEHILKKIPDAMDLYLPTYKGKLITAGFFCSAYVLFDLMVSNDLF